MAALLSIVLAGAAVAPVTPVNARDWFTSKDHPKTAMAVAERGHVAYAIDVSPDGTALRCETEGKAELDRKVCEIVMKSARFLPAKDANGAPTFGVHQGLASFLMPGKNTRPDRARLVVTGTSLPEGVTGPAYATVAFVVDAAGAVSACAPVAGGERRRFQQNVAALAPAACAKVTSDYRAVPARDAAGTPVASVQTLVVRFDATAG